MTFCPKRILMTCDTVGGVWRYAVDLALGLRRRGLHIVLATIGPAPTAQQRQEARSVATLIETDLLLDWMVDGAEMVASVPERLAELCAELSVDAVHLNLASQAAGFPPGLPVFVVSHSCSITWFAAVRGTKPPADWSWRKSINREGFERADHVIVPSRSHGDLVLASYGEIPGLAVIPNASAVTTWQSAKDRYIFASGRWWDDGKNGRVLDSAAPMIRWPVIMAGANAANGQRLEILNALFRGELPHEHAVALMRRAAIVVSPSLYEPFGLVALEAARSGAALVLADIPTYRELWEGCALFFDPHSAADLAHQVNLLTLDDHFRIHMAERAEKKARRYTVEAQALAYSRLYATVGKTHPFEAVARCS